MLANWDDIKRDEKQRTSIFQGIPRSMPSLGYADAGQRKAAKVGFDWPDVAGPSPKIAEEARELQEAIDAASPTSSATSSATCSSPWSTSPAISTSTPELALRAATDKFRARFETVEQLAIDRSIDLRTSDLATLDALWNEAKNT